LSQDGTSGHDLVEIPTRGFRLCKHCGRLRTEKSIPVACEAWPKNVAENFGFELHWSRKYITTMRAKARVVEIVKDMPEYKEIVAFADYLAQ
jgi:hypothetical protein